MATVHHSRQGRVFSKEMSSGSGPSWVDLFLAGMLRGWRAFVRYKRLSRMSDETLRKQGLTRDQIGRWAFFSDDDL